MSALAAALLTGTGVGLTVAAPVGPMSLLCIQRTLALGTAAGVATGLGAATVHLAYGALAIVGAGPVARAWCGTALAQLASALVLLWFASRILRRAVVLQNGPETRQSLVTTYCGAVGLGLVNPLTLLLFVAALPALTLGSDERAAPALIAGVFLGSFAWWLLLSGGVAVLRTRLDARLLTLANLASGLVLAGLAGVTLARASGLPL